MAAIAIVSGTGPLGGNHGGAQWGFRRASDAKGRTIGGLLQSLQHTRTDALCRFVDGHQFKIKEFIGVVSRIFAAKTQPARRNSPYATPLLIGYLEDLT